MASQLQLIKQSLEDSIAVKQSILEDEALMLQILEAATSIIIAYKKGNKLLLCGNGGSTCDAMHIAEELTGKYQLLRPPLPAISLTDASHITCVSNDFGFEEVFARGVEALGKAGDVLLAISTSGNSANVIRAAQKAQALGLIVIALSGKQGGNLRQHADVNICVPSPITSRIQEAHITIGHIIIELVENTIFKNDA